MKKIIRFIKTIIQVYTEKKAGRSAAELAYNLTLSLFPLLICLNAMLSGLNITSREIVEWGSGLIPMTALRLFADYADYVKGSYSAAMLTGAIALMAASGSAAFRSATGISREIMGADAKKNGIKNYALSFVYASVFLLAVYAAVIVILAGGALPYARFILLYVILFAAVWGVYRISAPGLRHLPGAFAAATALELTGIAFSLTVEASAKYTLVYGSISALIVLMIWLSACGNILIIGSIINSAISCESSTPR
ncbi:MAG: YihY/virulence factor BrkB family protein [Oscillospiraceae bacterium]|jgi:membrane protein|nr:YihY/virulence factor BrkB family protein [Oscillospiraceae bacterium]